MLLRWSKENSCVASRTRRRRGPAHDIGHLLLPSVNEAINARLHGSSHVLSLAGALRKRVF
jgi:hypothetical protein